MRAEFGERLQGIVDVEEVGALAAVGHEHRPPRLRRRDRRLFADGLEKLP